MKQKFIEQNKDEFIKIFLIIFSFCIFISCDKSGFELQRFEIRNKDLINLADNYIDSVKKYDSISKLEYVPVIILHKIDSNPAFYFYYDNIKKEDLSTKFIASYNRRIIGYLEINGIEVIVLSTENEKFYFELEFYKFLIPTDQTKQFHYIYFPSDMYCLDEDGLPCLSGIYEPSPKNMYLFKDERFEEYDGGKVFGDAIVIDEGSDSQ
jgi:hypothetical protein